MRIVLDGSIGAQASVVALGMFDGVHVGHRVLLDKAKALSLRHAVPMVVQTFAQHPLALLDPPKHPPLLTTPEERAALVEAAGADIFSADAFTPNVRDMPPADFVGHLVRRWKPKAVVVGFNYSFGRHGAGTPALLQALGDALGFETVVVPAIRVGASPVSATRIREQLAQGDARQARRLLGRPYQREVRLVAHVGNRLELRLLDNGKQSVGRGCYRVLLCVQGKQYPALAYSKAGGRITCVVPKGIPFTGVFVLRLIAQTPQAGATYRF
jgi:FAD synthase